MRIAQLLEEFEKLNIAADSVVKLLAETCPGEAASLNNVVARCKRIIDAEKRERKRHGRASFTTRK